MTAGHGVNVGHGYMKYVVINEHGTEQPAVVFPAMIGRAARAVSGALVRADVVDAGGYTWWTGEDALLAPSATTMLAQTRLTDPAFIPALVRGALQRMPNLNGSTSGYCVTGLPATWAQDTDKAKALGQRLRDATGNYSGVRVIPEPLGLVYSLLLDTNGQIVGDPGLQTGTVGVVDLGHHTIDIAIVRKLMPITTSLDTWQLGTARPLQQIRAQLSATFERELTLFETDQAVRTGTLQVAGRPQPLPHGWDRPLIENGQAIATRLVEAWGSGNNLDAIVIGGGGAELESVVAAIEARFPAAEVVEDPQLAIASGYARLARRLARPA
jgi:hypothetical protein